MSIHSPPQHYCSCLSPLGEEKGKRERCRRGRGGTPYQYSTLNNYQSVVERQYGSRVALTWFLFRVMDLRVLAQNHFAPRERRRVGDAASSDGDSDDEPEAAGEATGMRREDIVQLLFKSSLPLVLLVLLRNLMQYSVPIILYLGWIMIFHNLSRDFSSHLVFRNAEGSYALLREFLRYCRIMMGSRVTSCNRTLTPNFALHTRSLLLMTMVFLVLDSDDFASSAILRLLYFSDVSVPRADVGLAVVLHSAICIDVIVRTVALSLKIGLNIVVPLLRKSSPWRKICTSTNGKVIYVYLQVLACYLIFELSL